MKNLFLKTIVIALFLLAMPLKQYGQQPISVPNKTTINFDITEIALFEERILFIDNLVNDGRFNVINSENDGVFIVSADPSYENLDLQEAFSDFRAQYTNQVLKMDKETLAETAMACKSRLPEAYIHSLMMDVYIQSRANNLCANADPFCTDNGLYQFPAGVNAGNGETGPAYGCLSTRPNPAWYYMRIGNPGSINIYMYSTPSEDIDFCCWGPFEDPIAPCPNGLTQPKIVSCSYSPNHTENCVIPSNAQTGQYYILVITNYSNHSCNITFSKTSGNGTTDCGIMPPLVNNDGPFCVGDPIHLTANGQAGASYHWTGPNGYNSNQQNPTINNATMNMSGSYTCTITVGSQTNNASTEVSVYPKPTANFTATLVCLGNSTQFTSTSTTNPANQTMNYLWDFGDGQTSRQQNPTHQFVTAGTHSVSLTVSCGDGACSNTKTQNVTVYSIPVADAGEDQTVIYGGTATLSGSGGLGTFDYHWEPADKVVSPNAQTTQTAPLEQSTTFTLTVTHPDGGCFSTDQVSVLVEGSNMTATASANPPQICQDSTSQLNATAVGGTQNYTYLWSPAIGLSAPNIANPIAHPTETTTYTCVVSDGMSTQNVSTTVTVNYPEYEEETQYICPGDSYNFYGVDYSEEGNYEYLTTTSQGCEKVITLHLRHFPSYPTAHTTTEYICPGTSYNFYGSYYNTTGHYSKTFETVHGCDSTLWLDLIVYPANDTIIVDPTICTSQTYNFHGTEYNTDGDIAYFDTIDNHGCLLVEKLVLSVGPYQMPPIQNQYECYSHDGTPSYYWDKTGRIYTQDIATDTILPDPEGGCDIKYRLNLKFHQEFYHEEQLTVCDNYEWPVVPGSNYTSTNHHIVKNFPIGGGANFNCDSTYMLDLTVNYSDNSKVLDTVACDEFYWNFGWNHEKDTTITKIGEHLFDRTIETSLGCDSTVTLHLILDKTPSFEQIEGHSWVVGGSEFQYTTEEYWINVNGSHTTDWELKYKDGTPFDKWDYFPSDNGDRCWVYIYTYELDTIYIHATTKTLSSNSICGDQTFEKTRMIICTSYGTHEYQQNCQVDIYPNPNDGNMTLSFTNMSGEIKVKVFNTQGVLVDQFQVHNGFEKNTVPYNSSRLSPGVYMISITSKEGVVTKKVVIAK